MAQSAEIVNVLARRGSVATPASKVFAGGLQAC